MSAIEAAFFGALAADAERKISKTGKTYLRMRARVGDGDAAQWVGITCFDDSAIADSGNLTKGSPVYVEGRLSLDTWTAADGTPRHGLSVLSSHCRRSQFGKNRRRELEHA